MRPNRDPFPFHRQPKEHRMVRYELMPTGKVTLWWRLIHWLNNP